MCATFGVNAREPNTLCSSLVCRVLGAQSQIIGTTYVCLSRLYSRRISNLNVKLRVLYVLSDESCSIQNTEQPCVTNQLIPP